MSLARILRGAGMLAIMAVEACSPAPLLNLIVPRDGYHVLRDLAYGTDARQKLDLYLPDALKRPAPVILFFYGGSWQSGKKSDYLAFGQAFASRGIVVAVADYRLYPTVRYPAFVEDGARALTFLHAHVAQFGGDPARIFLEGHSAGAYIAVMLASDRSYLRKAGADPDWIHGVIGIAGPYDFLPLVDNDLIAIFGGADRPETQPINHIDGPRAPMLLATGTDDSVVGPKNTFHLEARLRSWNSPVKVITYPGIGHIGIILSLAPGFRGTTTLRGDITDFVAGARR
jgi:acetyl esterase/lipase